MSKLLWLKDIELDSPIVGNKARNLAHLYNLRFPVPDGFVVTTVAYDQYVGPIGHELMELMWDATTSTERRQRYERVKERILGIDIPAYDLNALLSNYRRLNSLAAVRSSSSSEDSEAHSFGGQHDSYLRVTEEGLPTAVKSCWASLFTPRSIVYRKLAQLPKDQRQVMAVLIQRFIEPSVSGVTFTRNPVTGDEETVVEYKEGDAEKVVRGEMIPKKAVIRGKDIRMDDESYKALMQEIAETCQAVESVFGQPQDIEWAVDKENKLYVIQARPLTVQL